MRKTQANGKGVSKGVLQLPLPLLSLSFPTYREQKHILQLARRFAVEMISHE